MKMLMKKKKRKKFDGASQWSLNDWISILAKGGGAKKRFQYCLNPNSSRHIPYFRTIQGQSGGIAIDPELPDNVLLPKGLTEYIYHAGNVSEVHSSSEEDNPCSSQQGARWKMKIVLRKRHAT